jgi:CRISPR-associated protein Csd2
MSDSTRKNLLNRGTGLLILEVVNSNPNGDPDRESDPRMRRDQRGEISPVSFKRKVRDLVEKKDGPVWQKVSKSLGIDPKRFMISESRETELKDVRKLTEVQFTERFWDGRIFGNTELEKGRNIPVKTGVVQFGLGVSLAPVSIERMTTTNPAVQADKSRGMAPLAFRIVEHGVYCMPFFVNTTAAHKTGCDKTDIDVLLHVIPYAYTQTASYIRPQVAIRHAWYAEHKSPLGSCSDFELISDLTPTKKSDPGSPSTKWEDYDVPSRLGERLSSKILSLRDLMEEL